MASLPVPATRVYTKHGKVHHVLRPLAFGWSSLSLGAIAKCGLYPYPGTWYGNNPTEFDIARKLPRCKRCKRLQTPQ